MAASDRPKQRPRFNPGTTKDPLPKKPTLDDFLKRGIKPPTKGRRNMPPDYDVITPDMGYTKPTAKKQPKKIVKKK